MCLSVAVFSLILIVKSKAASIDHGDHFNNAFSLSAPVLNFNDIFSSSLSLPADEPPLTTVGKDEDFHLTLPSAFVEFHQKEETTTTQTPPPPKYLLNSSYLKKANQTDANDTTTVSPNSSTQPADNSSVNVIPIQTEAPQRGVLDLLFPKSRVRTFKGVFDTFRRVLSHTFRKR